MHTRPLPRPARRLAAAAVLGTLGAFWAAPRAQAVPPRLAQAINESDRVILRGNVHPLARPAFDRGVAPDSLPMNRMMLLLKRSTEQEAALEKLMAEQLDRNSANYHRWLTAAQFGAEFGPSEQDIQTIEGWLESHGFSVDSVSKGRTEIEFSGTAGEVQSAFRTAIHSYVLPSGAQHWANSTNPQIPAAIAPVVAGIRALNNFHPKPLSRLVRETRAAQSSSRGKPAPQFTFPASGPCSAVQEFDNDPNPTCYMVTPADFAKIYNITPLYSANIDGSGETIAIANDSNINLSDVSNFRSIMGLPAKSPNVILANGSDPGLNGDESEAVLDTEWSGAVAPNATIDLVIAPTCSTGTCPFGGDIAAEYIINNNLAPILSYSFGACESGGVGNFYQALWQQAAAEGITVLIASGDNGSAGCDVTDPTATGPQPAMGGLAVNGLASTPYNVAVGGTDFDDLTNPAQYWNSTQTSTSQASAKGYVPEAAWNESCTNPVFSTSPLSGTQFGTSAEQACNNATMENPGANQQSFVVPSGGAGGVSAVYPKPSWQSGITPNDNQRDLPDVSLFAGTGAISASFYYVCQSDLSTPANNCSLNGTIFGVGGTSVSEQVMAGIVALIDQNAGGPQGNIDPLLYSLASQPANVCPTASPTAGCMFYDVSKGTITVACAYSSTANLNSPNCLATTSSDKYGLLVDANNNPAYGAASGYDLATGLGSINVANLASAPGWTPASTSPDFSISSSNATVTLDSSGKGTMLITITPQNGFTGTVSLSCPGLPAGDSCSFSPGSPVTVNGATNVTVTVTGAIASVPGRIVDPGVPGAWTANSEFTFGLACLAGLLLFGLRLRQRRWNTALAAVAFALFVIAGCSGNGSSPTGSGGGGGGGVTGAPFSSVVTATTCSATDGPGCASPGVTHSLVYTIQ